MTIHELRPSDYEQYLSFLAGMPLALFYFSLEFKHIIETQLGQTPHYIVLKDRDTIRGVLPCFVKESRDHGNVLNSLPFFGSNGGLLIEEAFDTPENRQLLLDAFITLAKGNACISAVIIASPFEGRHSEYTEHLEPTFTDQRTGQITELQADNLALFSPMRRRGIKKAFKSGITTRIEAEASEKDLERFYDMHCQNMARVSGIRKDYAMVQALNACPRSKIILARIDEKIIAGLLCLYFNQTVEYYIPVFDEELKNSHALSLAICEGMNAAYREGYRFWNFGGTWLTQGGVHTFKKHFGALDRPYTYYIKLFEDVKYFRSIGRKNLQDEYPFCYVIPYSALDEVN